MKCTYIYEGKPVTQKQLAKNFYKLNRPLKNASIFSQEELQESTKNIILKAQGKRPEFEKLDRINTIKFITTEQRGFFERIGEDRERLGPEYIGFNRIQEYIKDQIAKNSTPVITKDLKVSNKTLKALLDSFENNNIAVDPEVVKFYLAEIEDIIKIEDASKDFGIDLHALISLAIRGQKLSNQYMKVLKVMTTRDSSKLILGNYDPAAWEVRINEVVDEIVKNVSKTGIPISEVFLVSDPSNTDNGTFAKISARIDLITIDKEGTPNIYDIKFSKHDYTEWDAAKLRTLDWQLALYKQVLGQYTDVSKTQLYVIPIGLGEMGNPKAMTVGNIASRSTDNYKELKDTGSITKLARKLVPESVFIDYDESRLTSLSEGLTELFPGYRVKTAKDFKTVDEIMSIVDKHGKLLWYNKIQDIEGFPEGYIKADTREEFVEKITSYVAAINKEKNRNTAYLRKLITSAINSGNKINLGPNISTTQKLIQVNLNNLLKEYLTGGWDVVSQFKEAEDLGIVVLRNTSSGKLALLDLTVSNMLAKSDFENYTYGQVEEVKVMYFLNKFKKELLSTNLQLSDIIIFNIEDMSVHINSDVDSMYDRYIERLASVGKISENVLNKNEDIVPFEKRAISTVRTTLNTYEGPEKEVLSRIFGDVDYITADLRKLKAMQQQFFNVYPEYATKTLDKKLNMNDDKEYLLSLLSTAIAAKEGLLPNEDYRGLTTYSFGFSDFGSILRALGTRNQPDYNREGKKVQGIAGGLLFVTPDRVTSDVLRKVAQILDRTNSRVRELTLKQSEEIRTHTKKYYEAIGFSEAERRIIGASESKYENLFVKEGGKISLDFKVKNPYIIDVKNALTDAERDYLKGILFEIQKYMLGLSPEERKINYNNYNELISVPKIAKAIEDGSYFKIPLSRREEVSKYSDAFNPETWKETATLIKEELGDIFDSRGLLEGDAQNLMKLNQGFYEMYDLYGRQTDAYKSEMLRKHSVNHFELNLDTIAHKVAFNKIRKVQMDAKLPTINATLWFMKLMSGKSGADLSDSLDWVIKQTKLAAYDDPVIGDEWKDLITMTGGVKRATTAFMLALKPTSFFKEMSIGVMKGIGLAANKIYGGQDQFGVKDLLSAYNKLFTIDKKLSTEFNVIDRLNQFYGFANTELNTIATKLQTDRRGLARGLNPYMYASNTVPDYYNRMSLFLAKMIHDGSYEAHYLDENDVFIYDPRKDKRFSYYLANRDKYKKDGKYYPAKTDLEYNKQRNLYILMISELNKEREGTPEWVELGEDDMLPVAYTSRERASFKSFTDTAYGYYDKISQSQLMHTAYGYAFMQFMAFWPGKMQQWFSKPITDLNKSPFGSYVQATQIENGVEKLLWRKPVYNEEFPDVIDDFEATTEYTGDPLLVWKGHPSEGLVYSCFHTLQYMFKLDFNKAFAGKTEDDKFRLRQTRFALHDTALMFLIFGLVRWLFMAIKEDSAPGSVDESVGKFGEEVYTKAQSEAKLLQNTLLAPQTEPASIIWAQRTAQDLYDVMTGNEDLRGLLGNNTGMFWFLKDDKK